MAETFSIHAIFPNHCDGTWVSYTMQSLVENMSGGGAVARAYVLGRAAGVSGERISALLPRFMYGRTSRWVTDPCGAIVRRYESRFERGDIVYFWTTSPVPLALRLQQRGLLVVREMINCTLLRRRRELGIAYGLLGLEDPSRISDEAIERERAELLAADAVFCPNGFVLESVREYGVPDGRCIRTSYGWSPGRLATTPAVRIGSSGFELLFVGTGDVRKGLPWLLEAWLRAGVKGRLTLAGSVHEEVRTRCASILARDDVRQLGYVKDIASVYREADAFCFPSWEEGGPLVTIEAMAAGLPCIVTPMGGSGLITASGQGGVVVRPGDVDGMVEAIRLLAADDTLRRTMGNMAQMMAKDFTWQAVGSRRLAALAEMRTQRLSK